MSGTRFDAAVTLQDSDFYGGFWCEDARFAGRSDFRGVEVHGRTLVRGASFADAAAPGRMITFGISRTAR